MVTDRHTGTHTHTQDKYRNPPVHAHRGLINIVTCTMYLRVYSEVSYKINVGIFCFSPSVCDPQTLLLPLPPGLSWSAMGLGSFSFDGGSVTYDGVSLGSTATYTTSMDFCLNDSPEPFQSVCMNNEWTPLPNITSAGEVEVIL